MGAGLFSDHVQAYAATHQLRQDCRRVAAQDDGDGFILGGVVLDACQGIVQIIGLLIEVAGFQTESHAALLISNIQ